MVLAVAVLPGAVYTWIYEREAGAFEVTLPDRLLRLAFASAALHIVLAPPLYATWWLALRGRESLGSAQFLALWCAGVAVLALSATVGHVVGVLAIHVSDVERIQQRKVQLEAERDVRQSVERRYGLDARDTGGDQFEPKDLLPWGRLFRIRRGAVGLAVGRFRPPRAWDALFHEPKEDYVLRARMRDGRWVGGLYSYKSNAGRFPQERQDLLIEQAYLVDDGGHFINSSGRQVPRGQEEPVGHKVRLLLNWDTIDLLRVESVYESGEFPLKGAEG